MNEKFFDLKKEKQDRMINGALKIFAMNGYGHASTDDIVKEAAISKGLLFHYFESKLGVYSFIYDYSIRYLMLELSTGIPSGETDFFKLLWNIKTAELQVIKNYPYMLQFLNRCREEDVKEALLAIEEKSDMLPEQYETIMEKADAGKFKNGTDKDKLIRIIEFTVNGIMTEQFRSGCFQPEIYYHEIKQYIDMLRKLTYME